jgi:hypothetical protein
MKLPHILAGAAREDAHEALHRLLDGNQELSHEEADARAADLARKDPSLLTEHLDSRYGPQVVVRSPDCDAPGRSLPTSGTWCMFAAEREFPRLMEVALQAGAGPDDSDVFLQGGLLSYRRWSLRHDLLELALKYKADPDVQIQPKGNWNVWPGTPGQVSLRNAVLNGASDDAAKHLQCVKMLLEGGAKVVGWLCSKEDPVNYPSAAWELANRNFASPAAKRLAAELVPLMKAAGVDIDQHGGETWCPPVVAAARAKSRPMVEALIAAGCRTDDAHIVRDTAAKFAAVQPLFTEIDLAFGAGAHSWAIEAMMHMQLAASRNAGASSTEPRPASAPRARVRAL